MRCSSRCASSKRPAALSWSSRCRSSSLDAGDRLHQRRPRRHIVRIGVDFHEFQFVGLLPGERIEFVDRFDFVAEQIDAPGAILIVRRENLDGVAAHAKRAARKIAVRALVLQRHEVGEQLPLVDACSPCLRVKVIAE